MTHSPSSAQSVEPMFDHRDVADLMDCPFCGGRPSLHPVGNNFTKSRKLTVKCTGCRVQLTNAAIRNDFNWLRKITAEAWNRRAAASAHTIGEDAANVAIGEREAYLARFGTENESLAFAMRAIAADAYDTGYATARAALTAEKVAAEPVANVTEGCTVADAQMLREANHALAAENNMLRMRLRPFAQIAVSKLSYAIVEYHVEGDPEKQVFRSIQMQRAFNRAVEALQENLPVDCHEIDHGTHIEMVPHYGEPSRPADAPFTRETPGTGLTDDPTVVIATPIDWRLIVESTRHAAPPAQTQVALTNEQIDAIRERFHADDMPSRGLVQRIAMLAAPASPSGEDAANVAMGEREAFERWITTECNYDPVDMVTQPGGEVYVLAGVQEAWDAWMGSVEARAAAPQGQTDEQRKAIQTAADTAHRVLCAGGDYGDELSDDGLRRDLKAARDSLRALLAEQSAAPRKFTDEQIAALRVAADALIERYAAPIRAILANAEHATLPRESEQADEAADAARMRALCEELDRNRRGIRYDGMSIWDAMCDAIGNDLDGKGFRKAMDKAIAARAKDSK